MSDQLFEVAFSGQISEGANLADVKALLLECNRQYQQKIDDKARVLAASNASLQGQDGEQFKLNQIIDSLSFDD